MMKSSNPTLRGNVFKKEASKYQIRQEAMTISGTLNKALLLMFVLFMSALVPWIGIQNGSISMQLASTLMIPSAIAGLVLCLVMSFKPHTSRYLAIVYAAVEGILIGTISLSYNARFPGIVTQAALGTICVLGIMLFLYRTGVLRNSPKFQKIVMISMFGVMGVYALTFILGFFNISIPYIHGSGMIGILFSVGVIIVASMMLIIDFDMIERGQAEQAPKYMEWYSAFALLVTIIWLYLEILRLLSKLNSRD